MARTLTFTDDLIYRVVDGVATVKLRIHPLTGDPYEIDAILDTGAAVSRLNPPLAPDLGIADVTVGAHDRIEFTSASGQRSWGYVHEVSVEFDGHILSIDAAFIPAWGDRQKNLLGLDGFFSRLRAGFEHRGRSFFYAIVT